jgi:hypothetical protein
MKSFAIKPFFNLDSPTYPSEIVLELPKGVEITVDQIYNFVFFHIQYTLGTEEDTVKRRVYLVTQGASVPSDYVHIGSVVANEHNPANTEDDESVEEFPVDEETFYSSLAIVNVYIEPEVTKVENKNRWTFGDAR